MSFLPIARPPGHEAAGQHWRVVIGGGERRRGGAGQADAGAPCLSTFRSEQSDEFFVCVFSLSLSQLFNECRRLVSTTQAARSRELCLQLQLVCGPRRRQFVCCLSAHENLFPACTMRRTAERAAALLASAAQDAGACVRVCMSCVPTRGMWGQHAAGACFVFPDRRHRPADSGDVGLSRTPRAALPPLTKPPRAWCTHTHSLALTNTQQNLPSLHCSLDHRPARTRCATIRARRHRCTRRQCGARGE